MRRLFDNDDQWTDEARKIDGRVCHVIGDLIKELAATGASVRDIELLLHYAVSEMCCHWYLESSARPKD